MPTRPRRWQPPSRIGAATRHPREPALPALARPREEEGRARGGGGRGEGPARRAPAAARTWRAWTSATRTACPRGRARRRPPGAGPGKAPLHGPGKKRAPPLKGPGKRAPPPREAREGAREAGARQGAAPREDAGPGRKTKQGRRRGATGSAPASARPRASRATWATAGATPRTTWRPATTAATAARRRNPDAYFTCGIAGYSCDDPNAAASAQHRATRASPSSARRRGRRGPTTTAATSPRRGP